MKRTTRVPPSIGTVIKRMRQSRNLTLEALAMRADVSKSMLSQIERDRTNPTIGTVWRLAGALGVEVGDLLRGEYEHRRGIELVRSHAAPALTSADGKCRLQILGPIDMAGNVEWYDLSTDPGAALISEPHEAGTIEHLTVIEGRLTVESDSDHVEVGAGETARYPADRKHAIRNPSDKASRAFLVVAMPAGARRV